MVSMSRCESSDESPAGAGMLLRCPDRSPASTSSRPPSNAAGVPPGRCSAQGAPGTEDAPTRTGIRSHAASWARYEGPKVTRTLQGADLMSKFSLAVVLTSLSLGSPAAAQDNDTSKRLAEAGAAFTQIMSAGDKAISGSVLDKAECIVIVPGMKKGGFIVGGSFG